MAASPTIGTTLRHVQHDRRRILAVACGVYTLHDGFTVLIYVLLPIWQAEFGLSFAALGVLRIAPAPWLDSRCRRPSSRYSGAGC